MVMKITFYGFEHAYLQDCLLQMESAHRIIFKDPQGNLIYGRSSLLEQLVHHPYQGSAVVLIFRCFIEYRWAGFLKLGLNNSLQIVSAPKGYTVKSLWVEPNTLNLFVLWGQWILNAKLLCSRNLKRVNKKKVYTTHPKSKVLLLHFGRQQNVPDASASQLLSLSPRLLFSYSYQ